MVFIRPFIRQRLSPCIRRQLQPFSSIRFFDLSQTCGCYRYLLLALFCFCFCLVLTMTSVNLTRSSYSNSDLIQHESSLRAHWWVEQNHQPPVWTSALTATCGSNHNTGNGKIGTGSPSVSSAERFHGTAFEVMFFVRVWFICFVGIRLYIHTWLAATYGCDLIYVFIPVLCVLYNAA